MPLSVPSAVPDQPAEKLNVLDPAQKVARMQVALSSILLGALGELPIAESWTETAGDGLMVLSAVVMAQSVIGQAKGFGKQPAFAAVLGKESSYPFALLATVAVKAQVRRQRGPSRGP